MERRHATHATLRRCSVQSASAQLLPVQLASNLSGKDCATGKLSRRHGKQLLGNVVAPRFLLKNALKIQQGPLSRRESRSMKYICLHCETQVRSTVTDGQVDAKQQHCGVRFRVRGGTVIQSFFTHQCPACLTEVQSTKRFGRIRVAHKKRNGKRCGTKCWQVVCSGTKDTT